MRTNGQSAGLLGKVARLHYEHGQTHQEVAALLGLSRVKVTRLLAEARRTGVVEITVHSDEHLFMELEAELVQRFGLVRAWVGPTFADEERAEASLGALGAEGIAALLAEHVRSVTVGFSTSVANVMGAMPRDRGFDAGFVPATGTPGGMSVRGSGVELCIGFAERTGGRAYHLPAPLLASSAELASVVRQDASVLFAIDQARNADLLIAGMGAMGADSRMLIDGLSDSALRSVAESGAVGDLCAHFFDENGRAVASPVDDQLIGLTLEELVAIPTRLVVARGMRKIPALSGALNGHLLNALVTDTATAEGLLAKSSQLHPAAVAS